MYRFCNFEGFLLFDKKSLTGSKEKAEGICFLAELGLDSKAVPLSLVEGKVNEIPQICLIEVHECLDKMKKLHEIA